MVNSKNKWTLSPPVGAVSNRTGLECLINSKIHYSSRHIALNPDLIGAPYAVTLMHVQTIE